MHLDQLPLKEILGVLAKLGNLEFIGLEKIQGVDSVHFNQMPWKDAFAYLLAQHGLMYFQRENLIYLGTIKEINEMKTYFQASYTAPIQQVLIEARIVEADHRFARNLGVKLGYIHNNPHPQNGRFEADLSASGLNGFDAPVAAISMINKGASNLIDIALSALEADGQGNIIANPRIVTANQTLATIEQGTELPYQSSSRDGSKVQFRKANLKLQVTPSIEKEHILLDVEITKDSVGMKTEQGFAINTKHLKSQIRVEDGGTVVIGGIYLQTEREDIVKIPLLGDIPGLGMLFQHRTKLKDKTELLVFLTPSLINHQGKNLFSHQK